MMMMVFQNMRRAEYVAVVRITFLVKRNPTNLQS